MKKHILPLLLFLLTAPAASHAQKWIADLEVDSMEAVLQRAKDTQRVNTLNLLARRHLYMEKDLSRMPVVEAMTTEALGLATRLRYTRGMANGYLNQGIIAAYKDRFTDALLVLPQALRLAHQSGDRFAQASSYDFTGIALQQKGENRAALAYFDSAQHLYRQLGDTVTAVWSMINTGNAYFTLGDYTNAYKTEQTAYELTPEKDTTLKTVTLFYMANLFLGAGLPELTLEQVDKVLAFCPQGKIEQGIRDRQGTIAALLLGGEAYLQLGQVDSAGRIADLIGPPTDKQNPFHYLFWGRLLTARHQYGQALPYLQQGLQVATRMQQPLFISRLGRELARAYLGLQQYDKANRYAQQALQTARRVDALLEVSNAAETLSEIYDGQGNYDKAYQYSKLHKSLTDSMMPADYKRKLSLVQVQKELALQRGEARLLAQEAQLKEQQLQRELLQKNLLAGGLVLFAVLSFVVFRNVTLQRRNEKMRLNHQLQLQQFESEHTRARLQKQATELEMQALRAQMNPHFIFNCLNAINHFILKNETELASDYLTRFARLIRMVLQSSSQKYIPLHDELEALKLYIGMESVRFRNHFSYHIHCHPSVEIEMMLIPPMILQPFIENAIWHGLMHRGEGGRLTISIEEQHGMLQCTIEDNGIGRQRAAELKSKSASYKKSMGMEITANRLKMLYNGNGHGQAVKIIDLQDENGEAAGTRVIVRIPIKVTDPVNV